MNREIWLYLFSILLGVLVLVALVNGAPAYIGWLLVGLALAWLGRSAWQLAEGARSRDWPAVDGTVVQAQVWQHRSKYGGRTYTPHLRYSYQIAGKVYHGGPLLWGKTGPSPEVIHAYPPGKVIAVYYNPRHPERSRLRRGNGVGDYVAALLPPLVLLLLGAALIALR